MIRALDYVQHLQELDRERESLRAAGRKVAVERRSAILTLTTKYGWSQQEVADVLGISQTRVNIILNGRKRK